MDIRSSLRVVGLTDHGDYVEVDMEDREGDLHSFMMLLADAQKLVIGQDFVLSFEIVSLNNHEPA